MRVMMLAAVVAAFAGSSAMAQSSYVHHNFCLQVGPSMECAYQTFAQCEAAKRGSTDFCTQNSAPINHAQ